MTDPQGPPIACSLAPDALQARLAEIRAVSRAALRAKQRHGRRATLRFDPAPGVHERVAAIVAAEQRCCPFLDMALAEEDGALRLQIVAPPDAEPVLDELLRCFDPTGAVQRDMRGSCSATAGADGSACDEDDGSPRPC